MDRGKNDRFLEKFGWIRCYRCAVSFSQNQQMMVFTCCHTFCTRCFQKGCQVLDTNKMMGVCAECNKQAKFREFNATLPAKFLEPFVKIGGSDMMRAFRFQQQQWKWNLSNMSKKLRRNTEIMEQKKARWAEQEPRTMQLKKEHDAMYAELLKSYSQDELERLLSLPFDDLKKMDVSPESPKSSSSSFGSAAGQRRIDEYSPTSLYRQVLLKNASSSSSRKTQTTVFSNEQRISGIPIDNRPRNAHLEKVKQAEVRVSQPMFHPYKQQQSQQRQSQQHQRGQHNATQRPDVRVAGDGRIGCGTRGGGYHANATPATPNDFDAQYDTFSNFTMN